MSNHGTGVAIINNLYGLEINNAEKAICNVLDSEPRHIYVIFRETGVAAQKLSGILLGLKFKSVVKQAKGKRVFML